MQPVHVVQESRQYDVLYDPLYTNPRTNLYRKSQSPPRESLQEAVEGHNLPKYHKRPLAPHLSSITADVILAPPKAQNIEPIKKSITENLPLTKDIEVQTLFRDAQIQTSPFTPDFVVPPGEQPEILTIANLYYGHGLPAGKNELIQIELDREARRMSSLLLPHTDESSFEIRKRMLENQELTQYERREKEIDEMQEARLELIKETINQRDRENMEFQYERVDTLRQVKLEEKSSQLAVLQKRRIQTLRLMGKKNEQFGVRKHGRDIIEDYHDFGSNVYAPITRLGLFPDSSAPNYDNFTQDLETKEGIEQFSSTLPSHTLELSVKKPSFNHVLKREERRVHDQLEYLNQVIETKEETLRKKQYVVPQWRKPKEKIVRPDTPRLGETNDLEVENAVLLIQKLIRGRSIQNMMFEGKEKRLPLIKELRSDEFLRENADELEQQTKEMETMRHHNLMRDTVLSGATGEVISGTVDFLRKELVRVNEQQRIKAYIKRAEENRRVRECEEGGRRQGELRLRNRQQIIYRDVQNINKETVLSYTNSLVDWAVEQASLNKAYEEIYLTKINMSDGLLRIDQKLNSNEVLVRDLVASFLLPEVERQKVAEQIRKEQLKFPTAARSVLESIPNIIEGKTTVNDLLSKQEVLLPDNEDEANAHFMGTSNTPIIPPQPVHNPNLHIRDNNPDHNIEEMDHNNVSPPSHHDDNIIVENDGNVINNLAVIGDNVAHNISDEAENSIETEINNNGPDINIESDINSVETEDNSSSLNAGTDINPEEEG